MKDSCERLLIVLAASVLLLAVVFIGMSAVTERNRRAAVDRLKNSEVLQRYKQTPREGNQAGSGTSTQSEGEPPTEEPVAADTDKKKIAAFAHAIARVKALSEDTNWNEANDKLSKPVEKWTEEDWARQKELIAQVHNLISEIRHLAEMGGPACELDLSTKGLNELRSHDPAFRGMARLLSSDALVCGHEANYSEAVDDILAVLNLAGIVRDEPTLISQLSAMAIEAMACGAAKSALPAEGISSDLARKLVEYAGPTDLRGKFASSFFGEGIMELEAFDAIRTGLTADQLDAYDQLTGRPSALNDLLLRAYGSTFARPWLNMDEQTCADTIQRIAEIAGLPYYEALPRMHNMEEEVGALPRTRFLSRWVLRIVTPAFTRSTESQARVEAMRDLMRIGISVEQYHAIAGSFPTTLDAISPSLGGSVPVDPFTGESYHYQLSGGSFLLYSVGPNQTDDGGTFDFRTGDIVWRGVPNDEQ